MLISKTTFFKNRLMVFFILSACILNSCVTSSDDSKTVSIESEFLPNYQFEDKLKQIISIDDTIRIAYIEKNSIKFYNTDSYVIDSIQLQNLPLNIKRLDVVDFNSFAFSTEDLIFVYHEGCLERICPQLPHNVILATHDLFAFFPKEKKCVVQVVDYNNKEGRLYENNYLYECDFSGNTLAIDLKYGQEYRKYNLGQPRIFYSKFSKGLVLGLEYSKELSTLLISQEKTTVNTIELGGSFDVEDLYIAQTDEISDKMDNMFMRSHYSGYFGKVFYSEKKDKLVRMYSYPISDQKIEGSYLSKKNKKKGFLIEGQKQIQHFLPSDRYYNPRLWYLYNETFYYLKWSKSDNGQVYYLLDKVKIHTY